MDKSLHSERDWREWEVEMDRKRLKLFLAAGFGSAVWHAPTQACTPPPEDADAVEQAIIENQCAILSTVQELKDKGKETVARINPTYKDDWQMADQEVPVYTWQQADQEFYSPLSGSTPSWVYPDKNMPFPYNDWVWERVINPDAEQGVECECPKVPVYTPPRGGDPTQSVSSPHLRFSYGDGLSGGAIYPDAEQGLECECPKVPVYTPPRGGDPTQSVLQYFDMRFLGSNFFPDGSWNFENGMAFSPYVTDLPLMLEIK